MELEDSDPPEVSELNDSTSLEELTLWDTSLTELEDSASLEGLVRLEIKLLEVKVLEISEPLEG